MSFVDFVTSGITCETDNGQCRQLSGLEGEFLQEPYARMRTFFGRCGRDLLETVRENLKSFAVVGRTEDYDKFMWDISLKFDWPTHVPSRTNRSRGITKDDLILQDIRTVLNLNNLDLALWRGGIGD